MVLYQAINLVPQNYMEKFYSATKFFSWHNTPTEGFCIYDQTFEWGFSSTLNSYFRSHSQMQHSVIIFSSMLMDVVQLSFVVYFILYVRTLRPVLSIATFFAGRQFIQNTFLMGRPDGFLWTDPGFPALTVPYFDTNDFYYSGHVGICFVYMMELKHNGSKLWVAVLVNLIIQWFILMIFRTHYCIDMIFGAMVGHLACMNGERLCYLLDVAVLKLRNSGRKQKYYTPCAKCGWSNMDVLRYKNS